jgi:hypothetical protein
MESIPQILEIVSAASSRSHAKSWFATIACKLLTPRNSPSTISWSKLRIRTIRRDHYRCRGCDKRGDEITLLIRCIHPNVAHPNGVVTLCPRCEALVRHHSITGQNIPQFLQVLWRHDRHKRDDHELMRRRSPSCLLD